jgi:hypothetical protein
VQRAHMVNVLTKQTKSVSSTLPMKSTI